jgi:hypothetical protein
VSAADFARRAARQARTPRERTAALLRAVQMRARELALTPAETDRALRAATRHATARWGPIA